MRKQQAGKTKPVDESTSRISQARGTKIPDELLTQFATLYISQTQPSISGCRTAALGFWLKKHPKTPTKSFPSGATFLRQTVARYGKSAVEFGRKTRR